MKSVLLICLLSIFAAAGFAIADEYIPWDPLFTDNWILPPVGSEPHIYPINSDDPDVAISYPIAFQHAAPIEDSPNHKAKGMNALKFIHGGLMQEHLVSQDKTGSFKITNTGDSNYFTDILLLIAIDADSLADDFAMTINLEGQTPYDVNDADFVYYDGRRLSGFHSVTEPAFEPISYAFDSAMVCVYAVSGLAELEPTLPNDPNTDNVMTVEYSFDYVPAPVVFSVYGYAGGAAYPVVYHTNRAFIDPNDKKKNKVSTFAVTVPGDLDKDLAVDPNDFAIMSRNWLIGK